MNDNRNPEIHRFWVLHRRLTDTHMHGIRFVVYALTGKENHLVCGFSIDIDALWAMDSIFPVQ